MLLEEQKKTLRRCWFNDLLQDMSHHRLVTKLTGLSKKQIYDWTRSQKKKRQTGKEATNRSAMLDDKDTLYILDTAIKRHVIPADIPFLAIICSKTKEEVYDYIHSKKNKLKRKREADVKISKRFKCEDHFLKYLLSNAYDTGLLDEEENLPMVGLLADVDVTYIRKYVQFKREAYLGNLLSHNSYLTDGTELSQDFLGTVHLINC